MLSILLPQTATRFSTLEVLSSCIRVSMVYDLVIVNILPLICVLAVCRYSYSDHKLIMVLSSVYLLDWKWHTRVYLALFVGLMWGDTWLQAYESLVQESMVDSHIDLDDHHLRSQPLKQPHILFMVQYKEYNMIMT